jgi:hypothetical protein
MAFADIKKVLNDAMAAWAAAHGQADLPSVHRSQSFPALAGDFSKVDLLNGQARGRPLIQPDVVGPTQGPPWGTKGNQANLVLVLRGQLPGFPQMPYRGPYLDDGRIDTIADWIDHGCPD